MTQGTPHLSGPDHAHLVPARFGSGPRSPVGYQVGAGQWPAQFAPATPPRGSGAPAAGLFVVILALILGLAGAILPALTPAAEPTRPSDPPVGHASPGKPLTENAVYPLAVTGSCAPIGKVRSRNAYEQQVAALASCLDTAFKPLVEQAGGRFEPIKYEYYGHKATTPCGTEGDAYAFYCSDNSTLYLSNQVYEDAEYARLVVADVMIHEYGHHLQAMVGILDAADELDEARAITTRRTELQVFCWTYYVLGALPSFALTAEDQQYFRDVWGDTEDPDGHGSVKAQKYWGPIGLGAKNLGACNTWSVPADRVR